MCCARGNILTQKDGKLSEKHWEKQIYHKTWSVIQIDGDTSLRPKEHQEAVNDRKVRHPLDQYDTPEIPKSTRRKQKLLKY